MILWSMGIAFCVETLGLNSSLLHDRDTCWEREENNCTEGWSRASSSVAELRFHSTEWILERTPGNTNIFPRRGKVGNELLAVLCLFPVVFRAVHKHLMIETRIVSWTGMQLDRRIVILLLFWLRKFPKFLKRNFSYVLQFYESVVSFGMTRMCMYICGGPLGCVSGPGLHTSTHTRTRDQRQSGSHPCLPLICVPRPACPRCAAPYHARWHHAHQRLPTTVWKR